MSDNRISRRSLLGAVGAGALGTTFSYGPARAQKPFNPPASLVEAARKEGRFTYYTAAFAEVEQETINLFNKRYPFIRVEMVRAPGGQLITRVKTEAAAGKLTADVIDHSDRGLMKAIEDLFADYTPPNADDYLPGALVSKKLWPRITPGWCIAYNSELVKNPPKTWMDLTRADLYKPGTIAQVIAPSGGTTWTRVLFERQVLGEGYWAAQAATKPALYPSGAPLSDAMVRGEVEIAPLVYNVIYTKQRDGAPVQTFFPPEGIPIVPYATGIPKSAKSPNAAKLFLDWSMSDEGQIHSIKDHGNLTSLKSTPFSPPGFDPKTAKLWVPKFEEFEKLRDTWIPEWNKTFGYRQ